MADDGTLLAQQIDDIVHRNVGKFHVPDPFRHHPHIDPPHVPSPKDIANEINAAVSKATKPLRDENARLTKQLEGLTQAPWQSIVDDATGVKAYLDQLTAQLGALRPVEADAKAAVGKVAALAKPLEQRASQMAERLGAFAYGAEVDVQRLEAAALDAAAVKSIEGHLRSAADANPARFASALMGAVKADAAGYKDTLRATLEALVDAAGAVPGAPAIPGATEALDRLEGTYDLLPDAAFEALAAIIPQSELRDVTARLHSLAPQPQLEATALGASKESMVKGLLFANATISAMSLCLKVVPKAFPLEIRVLERQGLAAAEKGGGGGAAGVRGALALRISEEISLGTGVKGPSVSQVAIGALTLLLDCTSDVLSYAAKHA